MVGVKAQVAACFLGITRWADAANFEGNDKLVRRGPRHGVSFRERTAVWTRTVQNNVGNWGAKEAQVEKRNRRVVRSANNISLRS